MTIADAKNLDINQLLVNLGHTPTRITPKDTWYKRPYGSETHASFHVSRDGRAWFDFGIGQGGNIIELARLLAGVETVTQALAYLRQYASPQPQSAPAKFTLATTQPPPLALPFVIRRQGPLCDARGQAFLAHRALDVAVMSPYLHEVHFAWHKPTKGAECYGLGLLNGAGGYELRTTQDGINWRKTSLGPKAISVFAASQPTAPWLVFEGWPDFGAFLSDDQPPLGAFHFLILNGTGLLGQAIDFLATQPIGSLVICSQAGAGAAQAKQTLLEWARRQGWAAGDMDQRWQGYQDYNHKRMQGLDRQLPTAPTSRLKTSSAIDPT